MEHNTVNRMEDRTSLRMKCRSELGSLDLSLTPERTRYPLRPMHRRHYCIAGYHWASAGRVSEISIWTARDAFQVSDHARSTLRAGQRWRVVKVATSIPSSSWLARGACWLSSLFPNLPPPRSTTSTTWLSGRSWYVLFIHTSSCIRVEDVVGQMCSLILFTHLSALRHSFTLFTHKHSILPHQLHLITMVHFKRLALLSLAIVPSAFAIALPIDDVDGAIKAEINPSQLNKLTNADRFAKGLGPLPPTRRSTGKYR